MPQSRKGQLAPMTAAYMTDLQSVPATGGQSLSYYSEGFNSTETVEADGAIEHNEAGAREPGQPAPQLRRDTGALDLPLDFNQLLFWFGALMGDPDTSGAAPYEHVFTSGKDELKPVALSFPVTDDHWKLARMVANSFSFSLAKEDGFKRCTIAPLAALSELVKAEPAFSSAQVNNPGRAKAAGSLATFGIDGALVGNITGGSFQYSNNASLIDEVDGADYSAEFETGDVGITADLNMRVVNGAGNNALLDRFTGKDADAFAAYILIQLSANASLRIDMPRCIGNRRSPTVSGRNPVAFQGGLRAFPAADGSAPAATFTLTNQVQDLTAA